MLVRYSLLSERWLIQKGTIIEGEEDTLEMAIIVAKKIEGAKSKMEDDEPELKSVDTTSPIEGGGAISPENLSTPNPSIPPSIPEPTIPPPPQPTEPITTTPTAPPPGGELPGA